MEVPEYRGNPGDGLLRNATCFIHDLAKKDRARLSLAQNDLMRVSERELQSKLNQTGIIQLRGYLAKPVGIS